MHGSAYPIGPYIYHLGLSQKCPYSLDKAQLYKHSFLIRRSHSLAHLRISHPSLISLISSLQVTAKRIYLRQSLGTYGTGGATLDWENQHFSLIRRALELAMECGFDSIVLEGDSEVLYKALKKGDQMPHTLWPPHSRYTVSYFTLHRF